jgi:hypothetical protein
LSIPALESATLAPPVSAAPALLALQPRMAYSPGAPEPAALREATLEGTVGQKNTYEERLSSFRTEALFIALMLLPLAVFAWRFPAAGLDGWSVVLLLVAAMFLFYSLNYRVLVIRVGADVLRLRFGLFEWTIALDNIEFCSRDAVSLWRIGGAGIHFTFIGRRYRAMFNFLEYPQLVVGLKEKKGPVRDVVFSTRNPAGVMALLQPRHDGAADAKSG